MCKTSGTPVYGEIDLSYYYESSLSTPTFVGLYLLTPFFTNGYKI